MTPYFIDTERIERLRIILESWVGTPYMHMGIAKGFGADCAKFLASAWREFGLIKDVEKTYYPRDWPRHGNEEVLLNSIHRHISKFPERLFCQKFCFDRQDLLPGDLVTFSICSPMKLSNHAGIMITPNRVIHAIRSGVSVSQFWPKWGERATWIYRIMENE